MKSHIPTSKPERLGKTVAKSDNMKFQVGAFLKFLAEDSLPGGRMLFANAG
jgi:hypothetical protein